MSNEKEQTWSPSSWPSNQQYGEPESFRSQRMPSSNDVQGPGYPTARPGSARSGTERSLLPTRSSTDPDQKQNQSDAKAQSRSEDLNHTTSYLTAGSSLRPVPPLAPPGSASDPNSPTSPTSSRHNAPSSSGHSDHSSRQLSSAHSDDSSNTRSGPPPSVSATSTSTSLVSASCSACGKPMQGPFVRALNTVFHLNCFKCMDCGEVVASKFFPIEGPDGKQQPLCERDYFRRLNLICAQCGMALRGSYITACNKKYHVEHFTCTICTTLFGPQDSYYEHDGDVYCHFHYSTRFATKCAGCNSAILKQFVEINRNNRDECWHPECYMINKFWNVKVVTRRPQSIEGIIPEEPFYAEEEKSETALSLKDKQFQMEQQVYRIWTVLSAFEESSAACISDMLRQVSNGQYLDAIRMAEKFILHVEVLFAAIDDLEFQFYRLNMKGMSHVREARMLCRKTVELFTLLSHTQETGSRRMGMTQELLALVTGLAHYLKILIRIALTGALKLEREYRVHEAMASFLDKLHLLAVQAGNPSARRVVRGQGGEPLQPAPHTNYGTQGVTYGFRSLAPENAGESPFHSSRVSHPPSDLCVKCNLTVEEDCVMLGTYQRWHSQCVQCAQCSNSALVPVRSPPPRHDEDPGNQVAQKDQPPRLTTARRPPANVGNFVYDVDSMRESNTFGSVPTIILCKDHCHGRNCRGGFQAVQRLEQYAFLLNVALRRLYLLLKKQGVVPMSPEATGASTASAEVDPYGNSDIMRMKSVHLDRKLSATAKVPKRSTIVESPAGRSVAPSNVLSSQRSQDVLQQPQQGQTGQISGRSPPMNYQQPSRTPPTQPFVDTLQGQGQVLRPAFARNNTEVMIVDDSAPSSPAVGDEQKGQHMPPSGQRDEGITLADIPQLMEAAQAREQQRSLPRENSIPAIGELNALELAIVKHSALLMLSKSPMRNEFDLDELLEMVEAKKAGFWGKLFKADKKNVKKKGVFGVPLELLVEREGVDSLLGASRATLRVPSFVDDVVSAMRQMDVSVEGIFRKNGNIRRLKDLTEAIDRDASSVDLTQDTAVQLAALLKKFLRELPDPLMTVKLHRLFIASQSLASEADRTRYLHLISLIMPKSHRDTMEVLFVFLKWVASFAHLDEETGSKMDLPNLATVICPSILTLKGRDPARDESFGAIRVVTSLLENQDEFFTVPREFLGILQDQGQFANFLELPAKEFMKRCEIYYQRKAGKMPQIYNGSNGSTPRMNGPLSPVGGMPPSARPPPSAGAQPSSGVYSPVPTRPMAVPRPPGDEQWQQQQPSTPRVQSPSSRPSSYVQPRASQDQGSFSPHPYPNGYPSAVRQRT